MRYLCCHETNYNTATTVLTGQLLSRICQFFCLFFAYFRIRSCVNKITCLYFQENKEKIRVWYGNDELNILCWLKSVLGFRSWIGIFFGPPGSGSIFRGMDPAPDPYPSPFFIKMLSRLK